MIQHDMKFQPHLLTVARKARRMTQVDLGVELDLTSKQVSKWETGTSQPNLEQFGIICFLLDVSPNFLFGESSFSELDD